MQSTDIDILGPLKENVGCAGKQVVDEPAVMLEHRPEGMGQARDLQVW